MLATTVKNLIKGVTNQIRQEKKQEVINFFSMEQGIAIKSDLVEGLKLACVRPLSLEEVVRWTDQYAYNNTCGKELPDEISGRDYKFYNFFTMINGTFQLLSFEICDDMSENDILSMLEQQKTNCAHNKPVAFISSIANDFMPKCTSNYVVVFEPVPYREAKRILANAKKKPKRTVNSGAKTNIFVPSFIMLGGVLFATKYLSAYWALAECLKYVLFQYGPTHFCLINDQAAVYGLEAIVHQKNISVTVDESAGIVSIEMMVEADKEFELYPSERVVVEEICFQLGLPLPRIKVREDDFFINSNYKFEF